MYIRSFTIKNVKCFEEVHLQFPQDAKGGHAGWHVVLGENATGKTTLLQAMAAALVGPGPVLRLFSPNKWVRTEQKLGQQKWGEIEAEIVRGRDDEASGPARKTWSTRLAVVKDKQEVEIEGRFFSSATVDILGTEAERNRLLKDPYSSSKAGWLTCGYGAERRLVGGGQRTEDDRTQRVSSLFSGGRSFQACLDWLPELFKSYQSQDGFMSEADIKERLQQKEAASAEAERARREAITVANLVNLLLPPEVQLAAMGSERYYFAVPGKLAVDLLDLSDGYRSFLAIALDLLRQIHLTFGGVADRIEPDKAQVNVDGVVLIDEADLHLHPSWQRLLGTRLTEVFPRIQFIVTSHSPFIAQAAVPDGLFVLRTATQREKGVSLVQPVQQVTGWTADQILMSPLFGLTDTRDTRTEELLTEHGQLRSRARFGTLTPDDRRRLVELEDLLSHRLTSPGEELNREELEDGVRRAAEIIRKSRGA